MEQALQVINTDGVRGYLDENGVAWLNVEDVARGLGFVEAKKFSTSGENYVRWERVNRYLAEFGFSQNVGKDDFIPENMFYRLAMKANNEVAQAFQAKVADKILPSIRKHGVYATTEFLSKVIADPTWAIGVLTELKRQQDENKLIKAQLAEAKPKADYCEKVLESKEHLTSELIAKEYGQSAAWLHETLIKLGVMYMRRRGKKCYYYIKAPYDKGGYRDSETVTLERGMTVVKHYWTQKGRNFVYNFLRKHGVVPVAERNEIMDELVPA